MSWTAVFKPWVIKMLCVISGFDYFISQPLLPVIFLSPKTPLNVVKTHHCNWPLTWKDCDLQQTAPARKGAGILGLFPTVPVTHGMIQSKALLLCGGETEKGTHSYLPDRSVGW